MEPTKAYCRPAGAATAREVPKGSYCGGARKRTDTEYSEGSVNIVNPHSEPVQAKIAKIVSSRSERANVSGG